MTVLYTAISIHGEKWILTNVARRTSMFQCKKNLKSCKCFVRQFQALCLGQAASNQISPDQLDKGFQLTKPN